VPWSRPGIPAFASVVCQEEIKFLLYAVFGPDRFSTSETANPSKGGGAKLRG